MRSTFSGFIASSLLLLTACGGGGGGSAPPPAPPPPPQAQTITFAVAGPVSRSLGDGSYTNAASGGAGTGAVTYQSSNAGVATVSGSGVVTFVAAGSITITASKAADAGYLAATATYTLTIVNPIATSTPFTAWLGATDTVVNLPGTVSGLEFLRTAQLSCELAQFNTCADRESSMLGSAPILDATANLSRDAKWWLRSGSLATAPATLSLRRFGRRIGAGLVSFRGKLWMVSGDEWDASNYVTVWNSDDGNTWTPVTISGDAYFGDRAPVVEFNNRLWVLGGEGTQFGTVDDLYKDDIWSSADGITWRHDTADAPWPGRWDHSSFVFNNRLWVLSGAEPSSQGDGDDAWSSADGINWVAETTHGPFRTGAMATVMNGRIWVVGGYEGGFSTSVYSSADGRTWRTETTSAPYPGRTGAVFHALNGRLYLAAGQNDPNNGRANDVWSSADGITWVEEAHHAPFLARYWQGSTVHAGRIWVIGGEFRDPQSTSSAFEVYFLNDVWSTANGSAWREHSPHAGAFYPGAPDTITGGGRIWVVGGFDTLQAREEIWSSTDGGQWTAAPAGTRFPWRGGKGLTWFNNELWISGGATGAGSATQFADVWHSADGGSWTRATPAAPFGERYAHTMVSFNGQMFVIGGIAGTTTLGDVWSSSDGVTWTQATAAAAFGPRYLASAAAVGGRLWIFGGHDGTSALSDAWSTADGVTWRLETAAVTPLPRFSFALTSHAGRLFISGGFVMTPGPQGSTISYRNDVWSSADGIAWAPVVTGPRFTPRRSHGFVSFDNKLWVLGGVDAKYPYNDIWSSDDNGVNWRMRYAGQFNAP